MGLYSKLPALPPCGGERLFCLRGRLRRLVLGVLCLVPALAGAAESVFAGIPDLSDAARSQLLIAFDARTGVATDADGGVTAWEGRDGAGNTLLTAERLGQGPAGSITRVAGDSRLRFTESAVSESSFLYADLQELPQFSGGRFTIFWQGFYSGANPQGDGTLGRYAFNIGIRGPGDDSGQARGMSHQRRDAGQVVGVFPGSGRTYRGQSIAALNDTPTVWTTVFDYVGDQPYGQHFFSAVSADGSRSELGVAQPDAPTVEYQRYPGHLYLGAWNDGVSSSAGSGGFSFIGEMGALLIFEGLLSPADTARVEAWLAGRSAAVTEAERPEPVGLWEFSDGAQPLAATRGADLTALGATPPQAASVTDSWSLYPLSETGVIQSLPGSGEGLRVANPIGANGGGARTNQYTLVFDFLATPDRIWRALFRTDESAFDGDIYQLSEAGDLLGTARIGWSRSLFQRGSWQRVAITVDADEADRITAYVDGHLAGVQSAGGRDSRWSLNPQNFDLFAHPEGLNGSVYVSAVAVYDRPLTAYEVAQLGGPGTRLLPPAAEGVLPVAVASGPVPSSAVAGEPVEVSASALAFEAAPVQLQIDWGDGLRSAWSPLQAPETAVDFDHVYVGATDHTIRARARDRDGRLSGWTPLGTVAVRHEPTPPNAGFVRAITYNVWSGFSGMATANLAAGWLRAQNPDIVSLQELPGISEDELATLALAWGHPHAMKNGGVGITSRYPITDRKIHADGYTRRVVHGRTGGFDVFAFHKVFGDWRDVLADAERIQPIIQAAIDAERPVIALGDFNANSRDDRDYLDNQAPLIAALPSFRIDGDRFVYDIMDRFFEAGLVDATTAPAPENSTFPSLIRPTHRPEAYRDSVSYRIDYVLVDAATAGQTAIHYPKDSILQRTSDHLPVIGDILRADAVFPAGYLSWNEDFPELQLRHPQSDPDGDGIINLFEYILGGDPMQPGTAQTPRFAGLDGAEGSEFVFVRRQASAAHSEQRIQVSRDLEEWSDHSVPATASGPFTITELPDRPGYEEVRFAVPAGYEARLFARLQISGSWLSAAYIPVE